jgi:transcriptional regulator with XRE-family HTH domain
VLPAHVEAVSAQVARILREERERRGLSMTVLAERAGLSRAMISFVEREIRNPSLETLLRIAFVLEIDLGVIINRASKAASKQKINPVADKLKTGRSE